MIFKRKKYNALELFILKIMRQNPDGIEFHNIYEYYCLKFKSPLSYGKFHKIAKTLYKQNHIFCTNFSEFHTPCLNNECILIKEPLHATIIRYGVKNPIRFCITYIRRLLGMY